MKKHRGVEFNHIYIYAYASASHTKGGFNFSHSKLLEDKSGTSRYLLVDGASSSIKFGLK